MHGPPLPVRELYQVQNLRQAKGKEGQARGNEGCGAAIPRKTSTFNWRNLNKNDPISAT